MCRLCIYYVIKGRLNKKTKMLKFEARVLIGWLANTLREPANQNTKLKSQKFLF